MFGNLLTLHKLTFPHSCARRVIVHLFQAATEDHIRSLLSEDPDQDVDESIVDQLLNDWKEKCVPKKMKGLKNRYASVDLDTIYTASLSSLTHI